MRGFQNGLTFKFGQAVLEISSRDIISYQKDGVSLTRVKGKLYTF